MNLCVPDFEMEDDYSITTTSSAFARPKRSATPDDEMMELLWQNGQVVMQSQTHKSLKKSQPSKLDDAVIPAEPSTARGNRPPPEEQQHHLFMQEDEMAAWLHYPIHDSNFDEDFCTDLLYPSPCVTSSANTTPAAVGTNQNPEPGPQQMATAALPRPHVPPPRRPEVQNFSLFSRHNRPRAVESAGPHSPKQTVVRETTTVDSSDTPAASHQSRAPKVARSTVDTSDGNYKGEFMSTAKPMAYPSAFGGANTDARDKNVTSAEITVTSPPSGSTTSADLPPLKSAAAADRKRKGREGEEAECGQSEDAEFESVRGKKQGCGSGSTSTKRSRATEVHNLSERRRRDRINEKMKALQELIPRCNKSDKASMLDEAIEYLKSLQLQVQMMSMGCGMVPMIFPGVQQYMPPMGTVMGMEMGINRPLMPFPGVLAGSSFPTPAAAYHLGPRFPMPAFHMPPVHTPDPSRVQAVNPPDPNPMLNPTGTQHMNMPQIPNFFDPYQQYLGLQHMQLPVPQNQAMAEPSTSREGENLEGCQSGT